MNPDSVRVSTRIGYPHHSPVSSELQLLTGIILGRASISFLFWRARNVSENSMKLAIFRGKIAQVLVVCAFSDYMNTFFIVIEWP